MIYPWPDSASKKSQINKIINERGELTTDSTEIRKKLLKTVIHQKLIENLEEKGQKCKV